jgi:uncharacterized protein (UPF0276 family)
MINLEKTLEINSIFDHIISICENPKFLLKLADNADQVIKLTVNKIKIMKSSFELKKNKSLDYEIMPMEKEDAMLLNGEYEYLKALIEINKLKNMVDLD